MNFKETDYILCIPDQTYGVELSEFMAELSSDDKDSFYSIMGPSEYTSTAVQYAYVRKIDRKIIGLIQYRPELFCTEGNFGYLIRPSFRGKGLSHQMISAFSSLCGVLNIPFLSAVIRGDNIASVKSAENSGFRLFSEKNGIYLYVKKCTQYGYVSKVGDYTLQIETNGDIFSPNAPDLGTSAMLSVAEIKGGRILDLGCGSGIVGIYLYKLLSGKNIQDFEIFQSDILQTALDVTEKNCIQNGALTTRILSSGFDNINEYDLDYILSNPPYHTDFSVAKNFIEQGFRHLKVGGSMYMVTKRLDWYKNKLTSLFGGCKVYEIDGYFVFIAEKRTESSDHGKKKDKPKNTLSPKLQRKMNRLKKK